MMGAPGMRSAVLPLKAFLTASRLQFVARLRIRAGRTAYAVFGTRTKGGELISRIQSPLIFLDAKDLSVRSGIVQPDVFEGKDLATRSGIRSGVSG